MFEGTERAAFRPLRLMTVVGLLPREWEVRLGKDQTVIARRCRASGLQFNECLLISVGDDDFSRLLPRELDPSPQDATRIKVMAFPPLGIQTLAPMLRRRGHAVSLFDTCHPALKLEHLEEGVKEESPDVTGLESRATPSCNYAGIKVHLPDTGSLC